MKKTIVGIMTIVAMLVAILGTNVNAATVGANPDAVKAGEEITVSVTTNDAMKSVQYEIVYNPDFVEPVVGEDGKIAVAVDTGLASRGASKKGTNHVLVSAFGDAGKTTSVKFKALKDTDAAVFSVEGTEFSADGMNTVDEKVGNTVSVKIGGEEEPEPTPTQEPTGTPAPTGTEAPKTTEKPSNDGKVKFPQTGAPVYAYVAGIALVVIVAGAVVAARKNK